jgi:predicted Na+-dependent transporter
MLSILLGMTIPGPAQHTASLIIPALLLMMSFSLTEIDLRTKGDLHQAFVGFALNYILLSGLILLMSFTLENGAMRYGFVVMASVPPAVAVLPMTRLLGGDVRLSLYGEAISYLASSVAGIAPPRRISYTLFGSYKNLGLAAAVAIVLFGPEVGVPAAVCILAETGFYILLAWAC